MVNAISLEDHPRARDTGQFGVKQTADTLGRYGQLGQNLVRQRKRVARMVGLGNHHAESQCVRIDGEESQMLFVFPNPVRGRFAANYLAE